MVAYQEAGMAITAGPNERPRPGEWCICQNSHHSFFIIDYDEETDLCLTLEASTFRHQIKPGTGFVGHRGYFDDAQRKRMEWGRQIGAERPNDWVALLKKQYPKKLDKNWGDDPHWEAIKAEGAPMSFARLNLLTSTISMPFEPDGSPQRHYYRNEKLKNGFFPVGKYRAIHTGVHVLPPESEARSPSHKVRALAPGHIVALRLPAFPCYDSEPAPAASDDDADTDDPNELCYMLMGNHNGFALIRHIVEKAPPPTVQKSDGAQSSSEAGVFYSLYFHLRAPSFAPGAGDVSEREVAWLKRLIQRFGSVTVLDPARADLHGKRRWLAKDEKVTKPKVVEGGVYEVFKEDLSAKEVLDLSANPKPLVLLRPPERDLSELYSRLEAGEVVTFKEPYLCVDKGDVVGIVDGESGFGSGFVHWEVLTPGEGSMKKLLSFLNGLLPKEAQLPDDFFAEVKESQEDNFLEASELKTLVSKLPACDDDEKNLHKEYGFSVRTLREMLAVKPPEKNQADHRLAFDTRKAAAKGCFTADLRVANYQDLVPDGDYSLTVALQGGGFESEREIQYKAKKGEPVVIPIQVPGGSQLYSIKAAGKIFTDPDPAPPRRDGPEALKKQLALFQTLAGARWRNCVVSHLNEWTKEGLKASLKMRVQNFEWIPPSLRKSESAAAELPDDKALDAYVDAVYWWGKNAPKGEEHELFGNGEGQLPANSKTESVNPITLAWLLRILENAKAIRMRPFSPWRAKEDEEVAFLAWEGSWNQGVKRSVGSALACLAVQKVDSGDNKTPIRMLLSAEGSKALEMARGTFESGLFRCAVPEQIWGKFKLAAAENPKADATDDKAQASAKALTLPGEEARDDALSLEVFAPVLKSLTVLSAPKGDFKAVLQLERGMPLQLRGWIVFARWEGSDAPPGEPTPPSHSIPFTAVPRQPFPKGIVVKDGIVETLPPGLWLTGRFTTDEYLRAAAPKKARVSASLALAVQRLRDSTGGRGLALSALAESGLEIDITLQRLPGGAGKQPEAMAKLWEFFDGWVDSATLAAADGGVRLDKSAADQAAREKDLPKLHLVDAREADALGALEFAFGSADAVFAAERLGKPDQAMVDLRVGVRIYNGAVPPPSPAALIVPGSPGVGPAPVADDWSEIAQSALGEPLIAWAAEPIKVAALPHASASRLELIPDEPKAKIVVELLGGDDAYWKAAQPSIVVERHPEIAKSALASPQGRRQVAVAFLLDAARDPTQLKIKLKVKQGKYLGKELPEKTFDLPQFSYDNSGRKASWDAPEGGAGQLQANKDHELEVRLKTTGISGDELLELLQVETSAGQENEIALDGVAYASKKAIVLQKKTRAFGRCDRDGLFRAMLRFLHVKGYAEGATLKFKLVLRNAKGERLDAAKFSSPVLDLTVAAPESAAPAASGG